MRAPSGPRLLYRVHRRLRQRQKQPGTPPGTLIYEGEPRPEPASIKVIAYDAERFEEATVEQANACAAYRAAKAVTWIDVEGVHDVRLIEQFGTLFNLHPLTLEDIVSTFQRPKLEEYESYLYLVLEMMHYDPDTGHVAPEQVSLIVGEGFLLSFQEGAQGDVFEPVRQRLRDGRGLVRTYGADYLAYSLIDVVVDYYMEILEGLGEHIETLEQEVIRRPSPDLLRSINALRHQVLRLRRSTWPLRDVMLALERSDRPFITDTIDPYLRDVYDHTVRTVELIESAREQLTGLAELHLSVMSSRMNEVIKVLTVIATFFLPLTFITGLYGMNFNPEASPLNMPELDWFYGYPFAWALMLATALGMYLFFRRQDWI